MNEVAWIWFGVLPRKQKISLALPGVLWHNMADKPVPLQNDIRQEGAAMMNQILAFTTG